MIKAEFDPERILNHFSSVDNSDESYIAGVFTDDARTAELKKLLVHQFNELPGADPEKEAALEAILHRIHYDINTRMPAKRRRMPAFVQWAAGLAAAILIPLAVFLGLRFQHESTAQRNSWVEINAPAWTRARFTLPDGTTGWLNSNSSLRYQGDYTTNREVDLIGEAYFDVHKDSKNPFRIGTRNIRLTVLGTRFNVASYDNESSVEVVLEEGSLMFENPANDQAVTLKPNDRLVFNRTSGAIETGAVNPQKFIAWTQGKLIFRNDPLDVIARQLARWYNVDVELDVDNPEDIRWRATFEDESIEEVLKLMKRSLGVDYQIAGRVIQPDNSVPRKKVKLIRKDR